jgi:hypothetical protein
VGTLLAASSSVVRISLSAAVRRLDCDEIAFARPVSADWRSETTVSADAAELPHPDGSLTD